MIIPKNAKRVYKGILFDVYHYQQKMFDGSYETFEKIRRKPSVQIITVTKKHTIMLIDEKQPGDKRYITIPGGQVDAPEKILPAAKRELLEETGMIARKMLLWKTVHSNSKIDWASHYFIAKDCEKKQRYISDKGEKIRPFEVTFEKFMKIAEHKDFNNKQLADILYRIKHDRKELKKFKSLLFD